VPGHARVTRNSAHGQPIAVTLRRGVRSSSLDQCSRLAIVMG
jgi:hypothetical protein